MDTFVTCTVAHHYFCIDTSSVASPCYLYYLMWIIQFEFWVPYLVVYCVQLEAEEEALKAQLEDAELQKLKLDDQIAKETEKEKTLDEELER